MDVILSSDQSGLIGAVFSRSENSISVTGGSVNLNYRIRYGCDLDIFVDVYFLKFSFSVKIPK